MGGYAWVTLATNDSYSLGALVLAHSLKKSKTVHKSVVLITPAVSQPMREQLQTVFDVIQVVDVLDSKDEAHLALMQRPELGITFTKIHCWKLVEFEKCVFLDADTLVVRNCDELFEREEFSAAPDVSWPDCFNSGVFVFKPSVQTFNELLQFAVEKGSFDGGDQGLLNQFFSGWATQDIKKHLPFVYNLTSVAAYSYIPAFKHYGAETRIVHFIGAGKPWLQQLDPATRTITPTSGSEHLAPLLQQWWDLFCEKVHPNLNKNLESSNDGMSHPPVAACSNSLPIALTDDSQTPRLIEPCTPYREKDDFRQCNLPYQPFDVKGSSGELLNVEFLLTSAARPRSPEVVLDEEGREGDGMEEKGGQEETDKRNEKEEKEEENESSTQESCRKTEAESQNLVTEMQQLRIEERISEWKETETEEQKQEQESEEQSEEPEQLPPTVHPFDYDSFFPDETCINKYLEQNVMTYQPYDSHSHHQLHDSSENSICPSSHESSISDPQPQEDPVPSLPRFLTIPENDKRQSGNTEAQPEPKQSDPETKSDPPPVEPATKTPETPPQQEMVEGKRELTKSKSMPYLWYDVTEVPSSGCIWKSQPNVNVDPNKKYSMPKLKPILPRQNSLSRSVPSIAPKVTLYTEFLMSSEYKDPADLPKDKVGFVETLIHRKGQLRRSKSAADIGDKFGPLPYNASPEMEQPAILKNAPSLHLDSELYDLSQCRRQMGNKPKAKSADRRKENNHPLPALKPLVPPKDKKSTLIKKRKSKELSPGDGGREKIFKKERKTPKERKRECKTTPRNVSEAGTGNSVDEILTRLREFSKNYQHFFGVELQAPDKAVDCKKADEVVGSEWGADAVPGARQPPGEKKSEKGGPTVGSKFTHFRNYVKEKSRTSQKGLLSIQDLVSKPEDGVTEDAKASSETLHNCTELKRGSERCLTVGHLVAGAVEMKDSAKEESSVEEETPGKDINVGQQKDEVTEGAASDAKLCRTLANEDDLKGNRKGTVRSALHSTEKVVKSSSSSISFAAETAASKVTPSNCSKKDIPESNSIPVGDAVVSCQEGEAHTNGLAGEKSCSEETEPDHHPEFTKKKPEVGKTREKLQKLSLAEKKSFAAGVESNEDLELGNKESHVEETSTKPKRLDLNSLQVPTPSSCFDGTMSNGNGCPEVSGTDFESKEPARLVLPEKAPEESASKSSRKGTGPKAIFSKSNQSTTTTEGKLMVEVLENGQAQANGGEELPRKEEQPEEETSGDVVAGILDEVLTKATLQQSQTPAPPPPPKTGRPRPPPDDAAPPVGGKLTPLSPSIPQNGKPLPQSHQDMKLCSGIAGAIAQLSLEAGSDPRSESAVAASTAHQEYLRRQNWETGNMDYMGRDSFDNIWSKICQTLQEKEPEEAGPAAVSPQQPKEPSETIPTKGATAPALPSTAPHKCPEYIETLPAEPAAGPVEDDEIIFSKPDNRQSCLTNITEVEEDGKESSALGAKPPDAGKVKLSDILHPEVASPPSKETSESGKGESVVAEAETSVQTTAEKAAAAADEEREAPQTVEVQPEPSGEEGRTAAVSEVPQEGQPGEGKAETCGKNETPKTEKCTTVAIPSPPIHFPGAPFTEKEKKAQSRRKPQEPAEEKFEPIPLPPPETPTEEPADKTSDLAKDQGKQKKGVFTKILEMVGVAPKERSEDEMSKSVFYDVGGAAPSEDENLKEPEKQSPAAETETKELSSKQVPDVEGLKSEEIQKTQEKVVPTAQPKDGEVTLSKPEETRQETHPPEVEEQKPPGATKPEAKAKPPRNTSPKDPPRSSQSSIQITQKTRSPSPKLTLPKSPPPPPHPDLPPTTTSAFLNVDDTILETPPVPGPPPGEPAEESLREKLLPEVEDISGRAGLQERPSAPGEAEDSSGATEQAAQPPPPEVQVEELRVTSEEERMRHKGESVSSKLSEQILKAIPPPRRKAISEGSAPSSAIPKAGPAAGAPGEPKGKAGKASSIPVPPPRSRGKPAQPPPSRGRGKK